VGPASERAAKCGLMNGSRRVPYFARNNLFSRLLYEAPARRARPVREHGFRLVDDAPSVRTEAKTVVDVVVLHRERMLVESTQLSKQLRLGQQTRSGHAETFRARCASPRYPGPSSARPSKR
jgi:hypothetical protein